MRSLSKWLAAASAITAACTLAVVASTASAGEAKSWQEDLSAPGADRVNVARTANGVTVATPDAESFLVTAARRVTPSVSRIAVATTATTPAGSQVTVEARGQTPAGAWTEWRETADGQPAVLPEPVAAVQLRLTLTSATDGQRPVVTGLAVTATADGPGAARVAPTAAPVTYRLFATREGLVGRRTANGHIIEARDHFVALPSRRPLNATDQRRDYQVRVCYRRTNRCETAPVWDVGPWNTKDDYWNPSATRQMWRDLPRGKPEAQAAKLEGYNGGKDERGRPVGNPAGIDLADGTFLDGLRMTGNDWVDVTFLWTGGSAVNPHTPESVCGTGYRVIDQQALGTAGIVYLMYNAATGTNCVTTIKATSIGAPSPTSAYLQVEGGPRVTDSGSFAYYAGPVPAAAANRCVRWGGSVGAARYDSPLEHCG